MSHAEHPHLLLPVGAGEAGALCAADARQPFRRAALPQQLPLALRRQPRKRPHLRQGMDLRQYEIRLVVRARALSDTAPHRLSRSDHR